MAKVGVITLHRVFNYGSVLQAYATQKVIESIGHECEIIDYITPQRTKKVLPKKLQNLSDRGRVKNLTIMI